MSPAIHQTIYGTDVNIVSNEGFLKNGKDPYLTIMLVGHVFHVFVNGKLAGTVYGPLDNPYLTYSGNVKLRAGVLGSVTLSSLNEGSRDLAKQKWSYKVGLKGESLSLHTLSGNSFVE
ncbi:Beta-galactosidase [Capsicum baccatum]|uniref:Beta-galactosidase n=1 Tax=Capsicum baccatum TaxID=33114 RepID=A0A2G2XN06_CAPBA|nr:Beta-galactosidase [Capsicum baccatum]